MVTFGRLSSKAIPIFVQGTCTPLVHARAGRTDGHEGREQLARLALSLLRGLGHRSRYFAHSEHAMKEADYLPIINEFERYVRLHFDYLETMYGYTSTPSQARCIHEPRDAEVSISYKTEALHITIGLSLIGAGIALTFKNLNWIDIPKDKRVKWLTLDSIIAYRTRNVGKSLLHELTSSRSKYWPNGYLLENMELAIQTLASQVKRYAADLVTGDLSAFLEIGSMNRGKTAK